MSNLTIESVDGKFRPKAINSAEKQCKNLCFYICRRMGKHSSGIHKGIIPLLYEKENGSRKRRNHCVTCFTEQTERHGKRRFTFCAKTKLDEETIGQPEK